MKTLISLLIMFSLFFNSCKDKPTAPENNEIPSETLANATIGPEGGVLETDDFKLTVPPGAFEQSVSLKLYIDEEDSVYKNSVTPIYAIEGIPTNYTQPLEVKIKYNKPLSGILYIERGREAELRNIDTVYTDVIYELFDATEEDGFLTTTFPVTLEKNNLNSINKIINGEKKITVEGFVNGVITSSEHFIIESVNFPVDKWSSQYQLILQYLEESYKRLKDLDFDLSLSKWPKIITVHKAMISNFGVAITQNNELYMVSNPDLNITGYIFRFEAPLCYAILNAYKVPTQYENIIRAIVKWSVYKHDNFWKELALKSKKSSAETYLRDSFYGKDKAEPLSVFLEYLVEKYGTSILKNIMLDVKKGTDPMHAIISQTQRPRNWLTDFYESLLTGETWLNRIKYQNSNYSMPDFCNKNSSAEFGIEDTTTIIDWTDNYKDLSAKLYRIAFLPNLNENSNLQLSFEGDDAKLSLFKYKGSTLELINNSDNDLKLNNIKDLANYGYNLFVMVTNHMPDYPNMGTSDITLKIKHNAEPNPIEVISCSIRIAYLDVNYRTYYENGPVDGVKTIILNFSPLPEPIPTFENNIFYQAYSFTDDQGFIYHGNFSVQFNKSLDTVLTFSTEYNVDKTHVNPLYGTISNSLSGHDIPVDPQNPYLFTVAGSEVCEKIYNNVQWSETGGGTSDWAVISIKECNVNTKLEIKITTQ